MLRSLYPKAHRRYLSLPLLGSIADGFDDWLVSNGYTNSRVRVRSLNCGMWMPNFGAVGSKKSPI